jgi:hypothetical protein
VPKLFLVGVAALVLATGTQASGESFGLTATLVGTAKSRAGFAARLAGSSLAWKLTFAGTARSAELVGAKPSVSLCRPCRSPAKGKVILTTLQARLLEQGKATARLRTARGVLVGKVHVNAVTGAGGASGATVTKPAPSTGPAGSTWTATAAALRGQNGNRFEFVCPPDASSNAGPVWAAARSLSPIRAPCARRRLSRATSSCRPAASS